MKYQPIALLLLALTCISCQSQSATPAAILQNDPTMHHALYTLDDDPVVQRAIEHHELAVIYADADYRYAIAHAADRGQIETFMIDHQAKLNTFKAECLAALRQAAATNQSLNQPEKAATITTLANRLAASPDNQRFTDTDYFGLHVKFQDAPNLADWKTWPDWRDWWDWYTAD